MTPSSSEYALRQGLETLNLPLTAEQQSLLLSYLDLLTQWNRRFNLTAVRERDEMITRHLLDSLAILPFIGGDRILDVGTGAGLPGVPLAIADPQRRYTLLDSNGKKTRFLIQAKAVLGLDRLEVVHGRVEQFDAGAVFDRVVSRAFASLGAMIGGCRGLVAPGGEFLAMKGQYPAQELRELPDGYKMLAVETLQVPGLAEDRCVVRIVQELRGTPLESAST